MAPFGQNSLYFASGKCETLMSALWVIMRVGQEKVRKLLASITKLARPCRLMPLPTSSLGSRIVRQQEEDLWSTMAGNIAWLITRAITTDSYLCFEFYHNGHSNDTITRQNCYIKTGNWLIPYYFLWFLTAQLRPFTAPRDVNSISLWKAAHNYCPPCNAKNCPRQ